MIDYSDPLDPMTAPLVAQLLVAFMKMTDPRGLKIYVGTKEKLALLEATRQAVLNMADDGKLFAERFGEKEA